MKICRLALVIALLVAGISFAETPNSRGAPFTESELEEMIEGIKELYADANELLKEMPRDRFDRGWVLEECGYEPEKIAKWVATQTRWIPYKGVLRGAEGVLLDRQGNSLDRSLLLGELLRDAGYDIRLANAQLTKSGVEQVLQQIDPGAFEPAPIEDYATEKTRAAVGRASEQAAALARIVRLPDAPWGAGLEPAVADHWWVEVKGESSWRAFDSLLTGPLESERPQATRWFDPDELPDELFQQVTMRLVIERWEQGKVTEEVPLTHSLRVTDGPAQDFELVFVPFGFEVAPEGSDAKAEALAVAETTQDWLPLFRIGKERVHQQGFGRDGHLERNPAKPAVGRKMQRATSALGGLGQKKEPLVPILSACWIEYEIEVSGRQPQILRRELFDLIGPVRRRTGDLRVLALDPESNRERGLALLSLTRIVVVGADLPPIAWEKASLELWARQGPQIAAFVRLLHDPAAEEPLQRFYREPLIPLDLLALGMARNELSRFRTATYLGSPNILTTHYLLEIGDDLEVHRAVDLVVNEVGVMTGGTSPPSRIRLEQGVLDTVLETALLPQEGPLHNTSELFSRRGDATGEWRTSEGLPVSSTLPAEARARMASAVAEGRIVVAPEWVSDGNDPAWWEINPKDGTTLGIGSKGWGQVTIEEGETQGVGTMGTHQGAKKMGHRVSCKVIQAASWTIDVYDFQAEDRELHRQRIEEKRVRKVRDWYKKNREWRAKNLRTMKQLDELAEKGCK